MSAMSWLLLGAALLGVYMCIAGIMAVIYFDEDASYIQILLWPFVRNNKK